MITPDTAARLVGALPQLTSLTSSTSLTPKPLTPQSSHNLARRRGHTLLDAPPHDALVSREQGRLLFATYDGTQWVGNLVTRGFSSARGYKIFYSGEVGAVLTQSGGIAPVEDVELSRGWNWIGHAPLVSYPINSGVTTIGGTEFTADDQIKTRSGSAVTFTTYTGSKFEGGLVELTPGVGYEVKVAQAVTFRYSNHSAASARL